MLFISMNFLHCACNSLR